MDNKENLLQRYSVIVPLALLACALWGSAYPAIKIGYGLFQIAVEDTASILLFAGYRFTLAGLLLLVYAALTGKKIFKLDSGDLLRLTLLGFLMTTMEYTFFYIGLGHTTGIKASIVNSSNVFFSVILAHFLYKNDHINKNILLGCILGFMGVIAVNFASGALNLQFSVKGEGFIMLSSLCLASGSIFGKFISQTIDAVVMTGWQLTIGGAILTISGRLMGGHLDVITPQGIILLCYMILLSAIAFTLFSILFKYNPVSKISVFHFTTPVFGVVLSALFLGEKILEIKNLVALILVCAGIWLVSRPVKR